MVVGLKKKKKKKKKKKWFFVVFLENTTFCQNLDYWKYTWGTHEGVTPIFKKLKNKVENYQKILLHNLKCKLFFCIITVSVNRSDIFDALSNYWSIVKFLISHQYILSRFPTWSITLTKVTFLVNNIDRLEPA